VGFFFNHVGVVEGTHADATRDAEGDAIEAGAQEVEPLEADEVPAGHKGARFLTEMKDLDTVSKALKAAGWNILSTEMRYLAKSFPELSEPDRKQVTDFLTALDDHDDVHRVYAALR
jgi:transcriptional/translational regulatory protein YebC/TACO1